MFGDGLCASVAAGALALRPLWGPRIHPTTPRHRRLCLRVEIARGYVLTARLQT